jgi:sigma-B regulation protein RsbU (phosphoserine phosphatase)
MKMRRYRQLLTIMALLFAGATIVYATAWMYYVRWQTTVELGLDTDNVRDGSAAEITSIWSNSPAENAGLRKHDLIVAVNGRHLQRQTNVIEATWLRGRPGDKVVLTIERPGEAQPRNIEAVFRRSKDAPTPLRTIANQIIGSYPIVFLVIGLAVLFLRVDDRNAWLLALLFAGLIAVSDIPSAYYALVPSGLRTFLFGYRAIFVGLTAPFFLFLFSVFPQRSPLDIRAPWLKWAAVAIGLLVGSLGVQRGDLELPHAVVKALGETTAQRVVLIFVYGIIFVSFGSLIANAMSIQTTQAQRKIRMILWGTLIGLTPVVLVNAAVNFVHFHPPFWLDLADIVLLILFPLSFAYAVVKHQVLEIPALLRSSARYVLVRRGFAVLLLLLAISVNVLLGVLLSRAFSMQPALAMSIGGGLGVALAWVSAPGVRQTTHRIDRAFFREAYDARVILQNLSQQVRTVTSKQELTELVRDQLLAALHPTMVGGYLCEEGVLRPVSNEREHPSLAISSGLEKVREIGAAVDASSYGDLTRLAPELANLHPECLVPVLSRSQEWLGLIVLGMKLSEEPYSSEDKQLLGSVASQAGLALESITLAEQMAARMEADRKTEQEMQIARAVQSKLLPQQSPPLASLDYQGTCIQARAVGGDYYDFLDLGSGRVGFVLADIAGKGISGALLMANLQASLRSLYGVAHRDLPDLLCSVNQLFYKNTESNHYATMFFGVYEDGSRRLTYANCGHNPPVLVRTDGTVERLTATSTVLGLFEQWECAVAEVILEPGDVLVIYTDGVTEATDAKGEEFGEDRLISVLKESKGQRAADLLQHVIYNVREFSPGEQGDDITLIVASSR